MSQDRGALEAPVVVREMFDRIAPRYDLMNHLMTGFRDVAWRSMAAKAAVANGASRALDVATGTGDLAIALAEAGAEQVVGVDFSPGMIEVGREKCADWPQIELQTADAMDLPFVDGEFDACTTGWGLRNMRDYQGAINEMARVLAPEGRLAILELTPYRKPVLGRMFQLYFGHVVPFAGGIISGQREAYGYLPRSVEAFPPARELAAMMSNAGLIDIKWKLLGGGTVALHLGTKAGRP